jgi:N,N'-diacetyllegionaminate synthase
LRRRRNSTFVIAEAGVNHNGSVALARKLIDAACDAGADAVKFQTFRASDLVSADAPKAAYQKRTTSAGESQREMIARLELNAEAHTKLMAHATTRGIDFLSSPFDSASLALLCRLGLRVIKIPSGEITNHPFLREIGKTGRRVILSTGMSTMREVDEAVRVLRKSGAGPMSLLHCVTEYPAPFEQINLAAMATMSRKFGLPVGYSDHTQGIEIALAAVALGATIIEKHLTLDCSMPGPDHRASIEPPEFAAMVRGIRHVEQALGNGVKLPAACEIANRKVARKSLVATRSLTRGEVIRRQDVAIQRPGTGIPPSSLSKVVGRRVAARIAAGSLFRWRNVE